MPFSTWIVAALDEVRFVELGPTSLVIHDDQPPT
jgi:hypothetical protein